MVGCLFALIATHFYVKMTNLNIRPNAKYWSLKHSNFNKVTEPNHSVPLVSLGVNLYRLVYMLQVKIIFRLFYF